MFQRKGIGVKKEELEILGDLCPEDRFEILMQDEDFAHYFCRRVEACVGFEIGEIPQEEFLLFLHGWHIYVSRGDADLWECISEAYTFPDEEIPEEVWEEVWAFVRAYRGG